MAPQNNRTRDVQTQVKNPDLVDRRRRQIVDAAVQLFIDKGFHRTTTREIARTAGVSIGSLYEYVRKKEDVLYLVCDAIHEEMERGVTEALNRATEGKDALAEVLREYFMVCHRMSDHILLIYQETRTLPAEWRRRVLENEVRITGIFMEVLARLSAAGDLPRMDPAIMELAAHNLTVLGHMWTFRRWFLARHYRIEDYINLQTQFILGLIDNNPGPSDRALGCP